MDTTGLALDKKRGITGSALKIYAMIAMFIDHFAAIILDNFLLSKGMADLDMTDMTALTEFMTKYGTIYYIDLTMRMIGRVAFPIFAFLLVEGFIHTKNVKKYALNLGLFALISEIPFNIAFMKNPWDIAYQNVFFTLLIALLVLIGLKTIEEKMMGKAILKYLLFIPIILAGMGLAQVMKTDYSAFGVLTVAIMYLLRKKKMVAATTGCAALSIMNLAEITSFFALIPIHLYNGERGIRVKYLFYIFYPAHILIFYVIARCLNYIV